MRRHLLVLASVIASLTFYSCSNDMVIDQNHDITAGVWHVDSLAAFTFDVLDTTSTYDLSYNVRHAVDYPFYNLYVTYYLEDSTTEILDTKLQELILFDRKTGKPLGTGIGDLFDREILIFEELKFDRVGEHTFKIKQFMRMEELPGIMSFGLKVKPSKD
ncbi:gliding motility lipoprotein GldH [Reichenbachiella sp. MSK19-1]|uniref:gliding motility lipoprotein GldH n=1 Tax=Reichenbachiella sp. MSK19-1 TaxID=1897631 RepID=UPI000E6C294B|nr:gliding motility lipoprotein GldH [Reichenbachiella sp. MSK19-1]RJE71814.1 hypothetical protein BGP76_06920 [Reichenbachiella sp. MSK19-1]